MQHALMYLIVTVIGSLACLLSLVLQVAGQHFCGIVIITKKHANCDEGHDPFANAAWWGPAEMLNYAKPDDHYRDACHVSA